MPTLLAFAPHPDDEAYAFGPLLVLASQAGWRVVVVAATLGEAGERHDGGPPGRAALAATRWAEFQASCRVLGAEPRAWALPDGGLPALPSQSARAAALFAALRPSLALSLGPDGAYGHPDHIALHRWVRQAWEAASPAHRPALLFAAFPRGLFLPQYHLCANMMGNPPDPPAEAIGAWPWQYEVSARAAAGTALEALACHRSQLPGGVPESLFPAGIVRGALDPVRLADAAGSGDAATLGLLRTIAPTALAVSR